MKKKDFSLLGKSRRDPNLTKWTDKEQRIFDEIYDKCFVSGLNKKQIIIQIRKVLPTKSEA